MPKFYLIYLDRYHLGDELFIDELAQRLHQAPTGDPSCGMVHGSGEKVERTLESEGIFPERTEGVLDVQDAETIRLVERAVRESNQEVTTTLTDQVVPAVGIQGVDRGLLQVDAEGEVTVHNVGWVAALIKQRVIPVVSALADHPSEGYVQEVSPAKATVALAQGLQEHNLDVTVVYFTKTGTSGLADALDVKQEIEVEAIPDDGALPDPDVARAAGEAGLPGLITHMEGLFEGKRPSGTRVAPNRQER